MELIDVAIIGGGPAGLTAASTLVRQLHTAVVFDSKTYRNAAATHMHMVPTWDHQNPKEFRAEARHDVESRYSSIRFVDVVGFRKVILAVGCSDTYPGLEGYEQYHLLGHDEEAASESPLHKNEIDFGHICPRTHPQWRMFAAALIASLRLAVSFFWGLKLGGSKTSEAVSPYLKLGYAEPSQLWGNTKYSDDKANESELDKLWDAGIPWESGIIALENEEARAMGLPESQPFP
ncbi:hypothetical protein DL763_003147 [Monosporascus cannonballus]|nr:hypothetical protein DL763_003147 [Monosporascus cannonballus]